MKSHFLLSTIEALLFVRAAVAHIYVATNGIANSVDTGLGTAASPFLTMQKAQSAVRALAPKMTADLYVYIADGTYYLDEPLNFTGADSGHNGFRVIYSGTGPKGANLSGGIPITNWTLYDSKLGIYSAPTPKGLQSRHFYADQAHVQRARQALQRSWLSVGQSSYQIVDNAANFLLTTPGVEHGEIRGINSFTDRSIPIDSVGDNSLNMAQPAFDNNVVGYDTINNPFFDNGFFVENVFGLLNEPGEYYLNSTTGTIYYIPPVGIKISDQYLVLAKLEQVLVLSGTYDNPVHDLTFENINYMHTTWNYPSSNVGYADQQTGGYIGLNISYRQDFTASRPFWWQVPGSVQASASNQITFRNGSMVAVMGGFGIGNDANAHTSGVGLGARSIVISGLYFSETGTNAITMGGIQADAHHPNDPRMLNGNNRILENILVKNGRTYNSAAGFFVTYNQGSQVLRNDLSQLPYSGICYGYGWGANDAGGSTEYQDRGLYNYQPRYTTPTTQKNGIINNNLIHDFGLVMNDLGGIYTLSASPNTVISGNYIYTGNAPQNHGGAALYTDEGSRDYVISNSVFDVNGNTAYGANGIWLQRNESPTLTTGNLTAFNIAVSSRDQLQSGTNGYGDNVYNITQYSAPVELSKSYKQIIYNAGIPPIQRSYRPASLRPVRP